MTLHKLLILSAAILAGSQVYSHEIVTITEQELQSNDQNLTVKLKQAARDGFFYMQTPSLAQDLIPHAVDFANNFYKSDYYTSIVNLPNVTGYRKYDNSQVEGFYCERMHWDTLYPKEVAQLAHILHDLSLDLLQKVAPLVLDHLPVEKWPQATGGLYQDQGMYHLSFKHYRVEKNEIGINPHQDVGFLTLLYIDKKGLYAKIDDAWQPIDPKPGYLIVNFGSAFEILVNDQSKLQASWHFVEQITNEKHGGDRINFALFSNNNLEVPVHRILPSGELEVVCDSYQEFIKNNLAMVYQKLDLPK